jgi:seryl-tRNA synthetase
MIDIKFLRENPEAVRENIRKKFQNDKLPLVDQVIELDREKRAAIGESEEMKAARNKLSKANGPLFGRLKKCQDDAERAEIQAQIDRNNAAVKEGDERRAALDQKAQELDQKILEIMYVIPNIIDPSVPIGPDDTHNVEVQRFGEPAVPDYEIPHHVDIMASFHGIDKDAAGRVAGMGFYYLLGDIARLHEAVLAYARDFMIDQKHFTYVIPPFMMHGDVVKGVMSFPEMEAMMYKIEGEDLYLIGTSEHTMIGKFIDHLLPGESELPQTLTSYSPCFRKEVGSARHRGARRLPHPPV